MEELHFSFTVDHSEERQSQIPLLRYYHHHPWHRSCVTQLQVDWAASEVLHINNTQLLISFCNYKLRTEIIQTYKLN